MNIHLPVEDALDREEPIITVGKAEFDFLPPVRVSVQYDSTASRSDASVLHLTWLAAQDLYRQLGDALQEKVGEI